MKLVGTAEELLQMFEFKDCECERTDHKQKADQYQYHDIRVGRNVSSSGNYAVFMSD